MILSRDHLTKIIDEIRQTASENKCYPESIRTELKEACIIVTDELFKNISPIYEKFHKNGNTEKLFTSIFSEIILNAEKYLSLTRDTRFLIIKKLADRFTALRKEILTLNDEKLESESTNHTSYIHNVRYSKFQ